MVHDAEVLLGARRRVVGVAQSTEGWSVKNSTFLCLWFAIDRFIDILGHSTRTRFQEENRSATGSFRREL